MTPRESPRSNPVLSTATFTAVTAPTAPAKAGRDFWGMFKDLMRTFANGWVGVREEEIDANFLAHKDKLEDFEQHLTATSLQVEALLKAYDDLTATTAHLGIAFIKPAKFEKDQNTCSFQTKRAVDINNFANAVVEVTRSQIKQNAEFGKHLGAIYEYLETMTSVHNAFTDRSNALLHERSRYQKIEELKVTIRATEDAKSHTLKEYELIKENNMNAIRRFNKEKHQGLVEMLKRFVRNQAERATFPRKVSHSTCTAPWLVAINLTRPSGPIGIDRLSPTLCSLE
ncbi:hypothetical protein GUJ93_ZPchr0007g5068 [Zizania palustris]|uniref:Sorting nexin/Vps5-like C-terminal domain-containing protein n=1 Tax=Zizania palustris TaxID=103762 RepID=A0A8J5VN72_ZIZPA|nr:hypothetical protein GUJ93_ZPchr0007g5068 [Zizania palustris]